MMILALLLASVMANAPRLVPRNQNHGLFTPKQTILGKIWRSCIFFQNLKTLGLTSVDILVDPLILTYKQLLLQRLNNQDLLPAFSAISFLSKSGSPGSRPVSNEPQERLCDKYGTCQSTVIGKGATASVGYHAHITYHIKDLLCVQSEETRFMRGESISKEHKTKVKKNSEEND